MAQSEGARGWWQSMFQSDAYEGDQLCGAEMSTRELEGSRTLEPKKSAEQCLVDDQIISNVTTEENAVELNLAETNITAEEERNPEEGGERVEVYLAARRSKNRQPSHRMSHRMRDPREDECIKKLDFEMLEILSVSSGITEPDFFGKQQPPPPTLRKLLSKEQKEPKHEQQNNRKPTQAKTDQEGNNKQQEQQEKSNKKNSSQRKFLGGKVFKKMLKPRNSSKISSRRPIREPNAEETVNQSEEDVRGAVDLDTEDNERRRAQAEKLHRELAEQAKRREAELIELEEQARRCELEVEEKSRMLEEEAKRRELKADNKRRELELREREEQEKQRATEEAIKRREEQLRELQEEAKRREEEGKIRQLQLEKEAKRLKEEAERKQREAELRQQEEEAKRREAQARIKRYELEEETSRWRQEIQMMAVKHGGENEGRQQRSRRRGREGVALKHQPTAQPEPAQTDHLFIWNDKGNFAMERKVIEPDAALSISSSVTGPSVWKMDSLDEFMDAASLIDCTQQDARTLAQMLARMEDRAAIEAPIITPNSSVKNPQEDIDLFPTTPFSAEVWETFDTSCFNDASQLDVSWDEPNEFLPTNPSPVSVEAGSRSHKPLDNASVKKLQFDNLFMESVDEESEETGRLVQKIKIPMSLASQYSF
eukprot:CAMPEP_0194200362 /NCGR_PEP_ID=MMETSP0156-20130528/997_1 /TAXON_ID=33649 /ORGANISM="Thalassionema nitzschioides, Strain L26-B" /LENGTH=654 /DNA_ID=CAMNT_0038925345 /DNA_START=46 /DNA_END=2010 /DNA_ORIENTATION=+